MSRLLDSSMAKLVALLSAMVGLLVLAFGDDGRDSLGDVWDWSYHDRPWVLLAVLGALACGALAGWWHAARRGRHARQALAIAEATALERNTQIDELEGRFRLSEADHAAALEKELAALRNVEMQGLEFRQTDTAVRVRRPGEDWRSVSLVQETSFQVRQGLRDLASDLRRDGVRLPQSMYDEELREF